MASRAKTCLESGSKWRTPMLWHPIIEDCLHRCVLFGVFLLGTLRIHCVLGTLCTLCVFGALCALWPVCYASRRVISPLSHPGARSTHSATAPFFRAARTIRWFIHCTAHLTLHPRCATFVVFLYGLCVCTSGPLVCHRRMN